LESKVTDAPSVCVPGFASAVAAGDHEDGSSYWKAGLLSRNEVSGRVEFRTHQHEAGMVVGFLPESIQLHINPLSTALTVKASLEGSLPTWWDTQVYLITGLDSQIAAQIKPLAYAKPAVGSEIAMMSLTANWKWVLNLGTVKHVKKEGDKLTAYYDVNTEPGDCRMPLFNSKGQVVASHRYGMTMVNGFPLNGGEVDAAGKTRKLQDPPPSREAFMGLHTTLQSGATRPALSVTKCGSLHVTLPKTGQKLARAPGSFDGKWWPLKQLDFPLASDYLVGKPPMSMVAMEVSKFAAKLPPWPFTEAETLEAFRFVAKSDQHTSVPAPNMGDRKAVFARFAQVLDGLNPSSNPGYTQFPDLNGEPLQGIDYSSQREYATALGCGDFAAGCSQIATCMTNFLEELMNSDSPSEMATEVLWKVQGKRDKYKAASVAIGKVRSIQAPPMHYKLVWMFLMWESDRAWVHDPDSDNYTGIPVNCPLPPKLMERLDSAYGATSTDITGYDRNMHRDIMQMFFFVYVPLMAPGADPRILAYLAGAAIDSRLVMPDGVVYYKDHGNPSGFPNTIRLNCVTHKVTSLLCKVAALEEITLEQAPSAFSAFTAQPMQQRIRTVEKITRSLYCGDDCLNTAKDERGMDVLRRSPKYWAKTPWHVKEEGDHVFDRTGDLPDYHNCPSFISRTPMRLFDEWYHALDKPQKVVSKILYGPLDDPTYEDRLLGVEQSLVFGLVEHVLSRHAGEGGTNPIYDWMEANFRTFSTLPFLVQTLVQGRDHTVLKKRRKGEHVPREPRQGDGRHQPPMHPSGSVAEASG